MILRVVAMANQPSGARATVALSPRVRAAWNRTPTSTNFWAALSAYNLVIGSVFLIGAPARIAGPSFETVRDYGGPVLWGVALLAVGALVLVGPFAGARVLAGALTTAALLHLLLAAGFIAAATVNEQAALTGPVTYTLVAGMHGLHARHYWRIP